jgi:hypothetical protein
MAAEMAVNTPQELWRRAARGTTAGAVILDEQERVLLVKHSYGPRNWEISDFTLRRIRDAVEGVPRLLPVRVGERHILT